MDNSDLTDDGLELISRIPGLEELSVRRTKITDDGLLCPTRVGGLEEIDTRETRVTPAGIDSLKARFPNLEAAKCCRARKPLMDQ